MPSPRFGSLLLAPPLAFPQALLAEGVARHAGLLDAKLDELLSHAQVFEHPGGPLSSIDTLAGRLVRRSDGRLDVDVQASPNIRDDVLPYRGIQRALFLLPAHGHFHVVVEAFGVASLHLLRVGDPAAANETVSPRLVVAEPLDQTHRESGRWTVTRWVPPGPRAEARYAWVQTPAPPASFAESASRLVALYDAAIRARLDVFRGESGGLEPLVILGTSSFTGDSIVVDERRPAGGLPPLLMVRGTPEIARVIVGESRPGLAPVYVTAGWTTALRWIDLGANGDGDGVGPMMEEDASLFQRAVAGKDEHADSDVSVPDEDDEAGTDGATRTGETTATPGTEGKRKRHPLAEFLDEGNRECIDEEIDRLVELSEGEVDQAIAAAGFDPAKERAEGAGLREEVLNRMWRRRDEAEDGGES